MPVPAAKDSREADGDAVSARLSEGLRACRSVVKDYRLALGMSIPEDGQSDDGELPNDTPDND